MNDELSYNAMWTKDKRGGVIICQAGVDQSYDHRSKERHARSWSYPTVLLGRTESRQRNHWMDIIRYHHVRHQFMWYPQIIMHDEANGQSNETHQSRSRRQSYDRIQLTAIFVSWQTAKAAACWSLAKSSINNDATHHWLKNHVRVMQQPTREGWRAMEQSNTAINTYHLS